ncbi:uncharacterized protein [Diadema antillarum]|uniref:uncharacterized protein n=1 Tax=Diadema antillarum TaxID=105358 RepID=UPI003A840AAB
MFVFSLDDEKSNLALQVLPLLFPAGVKKQGQRSVQRATMEESMPAFINVEKLFREMSLFAFLHIDGTNLPMYLEGKREPHVLVFGERKNPEQAFVAVEGDAIPCTSLLKAVDVCFKLTYVLDISYCWQCSHTYTYLQKYVYGLGMGDGPPTSSVVLLNSFVEQE